LPFYFGSPYAPAAFWRHLEAYTPIQYVDTIGAGAMQWRNIANYVGRGIVTSIANFINPARNFRMSVDGGGWINFVMENGEVFNPMVGFDTSIQIQHQRTVAAAVNGHVWLIHE